MTSFESSLRELVTRTHRDTHPVVTSPADQSAPTWHFDVTWTLDPVTDYGDDHVVLTPSTTNADYDELVLPADGPLAVTVTKIGAMGLRVTTGRLRTNGRLVLVLDVESAAWAYGRYRSELESSGTGPVPDDEESRLVLLYGYMVAQFLADFDYISSTRLEVSFHDWYTLVGLVFLQNWCCVPASTTVFLGTDSALLALLDCASDFYAEECCTGTVPDAAKLVSDIDSASQEALQGFKALAVTNNRARWCIFL